MSQGILGTNVVAQIGILVHDIEATSQKFTEVFGLEKPNVIVTDEVEQAQTEFEGRRTEARAKLAFFQMGNLQLELIEPDRHPSTWRNYLDEHGEGVHHIAFVIEGMKEKIALFEQRGMPLQQKGEYKGGRYAYLDATGPLKMIIELLENDKP